MIPLCKPTLLKALSLDKQLPAKPVANYKKSIVLTPCTILKCKSTMPCLINGLVPDIAVELALVTVAIIW